MEREVWARAGMVLSVLALVALILVTPYILGQPSPELTSLPLLIIGMTENESEFIVNVGAALQVYRYDVIRLDLNGTDPRVNGTYNRTEEYSLSLKIPANGTLNLHTYLIDQMRNYFEYNVSVATESGDDGNTVMVFTFPYEEEATSTRIRVVSTADLRLPIPLRGKLEATP